MSELYVRTFGRTRGSSRMRVAVSLAASQSPDRAHASMNELYTPSSHAPASMASHSAFFAARISPAFPAAEMSPLYANASGARLESA